MPFWDEDASTDDYAAYAAASNLALNATTGISAGSPDFDLFGTFNRGFATVTQAATSALQLQGSIQGLQDQREDRALARYIRAAQIDTAKLLVPLQQQTELARARAALQTAGVPNWMLLLTAAGVVVGAMALLK